MEKRHNTYTRTKIKIVVDFSGTVQIRNWWNDVFKVLNLKKNTVNSLISENIFTKWKWHKDFFWLSVRKCITSTDTIKEMLKKVLWMERIRIETESQIFTKKCWTMEIVKMKQAIFKGFVCSLFYILLY